MKLKKILGNTAAVLGVILLALVFGGAYGDMVLYHGCRHRLRLLEFFITASGERGYDLFYFDGFIYAVFFLALLLFAFKNRSPDENRP